MNEKVEVLISAMHQSDVDFFTNANILSDGLLINQCDKDDVVEMDKNGKHYKMISTTERGLSRSRNMALDNAHGDFCLICDDDELLYDGYEEKIKETYRKYPDADIICFKILIDKKSYSTKAYRIGYLRALRIASVQVSFKLESIKNSGVKFDENYGSGTPMGSGEENIFMYDCLKNGLRAYYVPIVIGEVLQTDSKWFKGYNEDYFFKRGAIICRLMGKFGYIYCIYFVFTKYKLYKNNLGMWKAFSLMMKGMKK
mgnify:CR=1 FL=1